MPSDEKKAKEWDKEMAAYRGGYLGIVKHKAFDVLMEQVFGFLFGAGFFAASRMLVGMGLMKLGVFSAQRSRRFYLWMVGLGYGLGLPLMIFDAIELIRHRFSSDYFMHGGIFYNVFGSLVVALGHVGLLMLIVQSGALGWLTTRLAAVGRMALTNYLFDSIACTTLFYGYGFGLFGHINRTGLAAIVLTFWIIQLLVSPIWLKYFRYGPAEWLWRSLTYWRLQPMRAEAGGKLRRLLAVIRIRTASGCSTVASRYIHAGPRIVAYLARKRLLYRRLLAASRSGPLLVRRSVCWIAGSP